MFCISQFGLLLKSHKLGNINKFISQSCGGWEFTIKMSTGFTAVRMLPNILKRDNISSTYLLCIIEEKETHLSYFIKP